MDSREISHRWYSRFDEATMMLILHEGDEEEIAVPAKYEVCETCRGKGRHVNPSIDRNGLTREDFDEDPGFEEDYRAGVYDVPCVECGGERVVPVLDEDLATATEKTAAEEAIKEYYQDQQEQWHAREYGY